MTTTVAAPIRSPSPLLSPQEVAPACQAIALDQSIGVRMEYIHDGADETKEDRRNGYRLDDI